MIKICFFDIDGTLVDMETKIISKNTLDALHALQAQGILIVLATGRSPMTLPHFQDIQFDAFLTFNGSLCFNEDGILYHQPIPHEDVLKIIENASSLNRPVALASKTLLRANGYDQDLADYYGFANQSLVPSPLFEEMLHQDIYQVMMGAYPNEYDCILKDVSGAKIAAWWHRAIDIIPKNGGKGVAIENMLNRLHISKDEAMAFGDGNNDIEMLQAVGLGIAMENASVDLKKVADDICGHVKDDGVYHYLLQHGYI